MQVLTHKCHVPTPAIFHELPYQSYYGATLSSDPSTWELLRLAIENMTNVETLRIVNGHYFLTAILLRGFFMPGRKMNKKVSKLWLESCAIDSILFPTFKPESELFPARVFDMSGLKSLRVRRLRMDKCNDLWVHSRGGLMTHFHNGKGGLYPTTVYKGSPDCVYQPPHMNPWQEESNLSLEYPYVDVFNRAIQKATPEVDRYFQAAFSADRKSIPRNYVYDEKMDQASCTDDDLKLVENVPPVPSRTLVMLLRSTASNLTSLNLDWILMNKGSSYSGSSFNSLFFCEMLAKLRFPHLRAFQYRNANIADTQLPSALYLLHPFVIEPSEDPERDGEVRVDFLEFMEAHTKLECLAWPMDRFYTHECVDSAEAERARHVVMELGRSLTSLRVDAEYSAFRDTQTDDRTDHSLKQERHRRRKFISEFAAQMTKLKSIKMEGGIPRDEKREVVRALHRCPLEKLVFICMSYPIGNTWGENGDALLVLDEGNQHGNIQFAMPLEAEAEEAIAQSTALAKPSKDPEFVFHAKYGWPAGPPLVHTIATFFADTITELKFCGTNGSPILHRPTKITAGLLHHLRHFRNLRQLITSFFLLTFFDYDWREAEIIKYWLDTQASGTALVPADPAAALEDDTRTLGDEQENDGQPQGDEANGNEDIGIDSNAMQSVVLSSNNDNADDFSQFTYITLLPAEEDGLGDDTAMDVDGDDDTIVPPVPTPEVSPMEAMLKERFSPAAMAAGINDVFGPHLHHEAKARLDSNKRNVGVHIRVGYAIGVEQEDIFDFDVWVGTAGVLDWRGPRPEGDTNRWWRKLESRLWF